MSATTTRSEQATIMAHIKDNWASTPVAWPNVAYVPDDETSYLEPIVNRQEAFNTDMGPTKNVRYPGLLTGNIRVPLNQGDGTAYGLADTFAGLFRNSHISGLHFRAPTIRRGKPDPLNPGWFLVQVDCPFWRDTIH